MEKLVSSVTTYNPEKIAKAIYEAQEKLSSVLKGTMLLPWDEKPSKEIEIEVELATKLIFLSYPHYTIDCNLALNTCNDIMEDGYFSTDEDETVEMFQVYAALFNLIMKDKS